MLDSKIEKWGYEAIIDYRMSEKFGLDWKKYPTIRMQTFLHILIAEGERQEKDTKKLRTYGNTKPGFNNYSKR